MQALGTIRAERRAGVEGGFVGREIQGPLSPLPRSVNGEETSEDLFSPSEIGTQLVMITLPRWLRAAGIVMILASLAWTGDYARDSSNINGSGPSWCG